jgi:hypothetical protein
MRKVKMCATRSLCCKQHNQRSLQVSTTNAWCCSVHWNMKPQSHYKLQMTVKSRELEKRQLSSQHSVYDLEINRLLSIFERLISCRHNNSLTTAKKCHFHLRPWSPFHAGRPSSVLIHMALKYFAKRSEMQSGRFNFFFGWTTDCLQISTYQSVHCFLQ